MKDQEILKKALGLADMCGTGLEAGQLGPIEFGEVSQELPGARGEVAAGEVRKLAKLGEEFHFEGEHGSRPGRFGRKMPKEPGVEFEQLWQRRF